MPNMSQMVINQKRSGIREIVELSLGMDGVYHMEIGEPLFDTPKHIIEAGCNALRSGYTKYTPNAGFPFLTKAISERLNRDYGLALKSGNIVVTAGGVQAIAGAVRVLTEIGDEVLVPDPGWPNYDTIIMASGAVPVKYKLKPENSFYPCFEEMEKLITSRTKVLIVNTPSNPLGVVFPEEVMKRIAEFARSKDLFVISDEVYEKIVFEGKHISALPYDTDGRVVAIYTMSKTYAMTGWRIGYAASTERIISQMTKMQEAYVSCAPSAFQKAAEAALTGPQDCIDYMKEAYNKNRKKAAAILSGYGIDFFEPKGAFYMWVNAKCKDSSQFAKDLLLDRKVAVAPGITFGPSGKQYVRLSLASSEETVEKGVRILAEYIVEKNCK
ncbi:MAG: pyridoxal phosphate-dependent aminotransferase [Caulobacteraceae bacterium]